MPDKEKILEKIKKLLALAQDKGATPAEAATAAAKASKLLLLHNLELADVEAHAGKEKTAYTKRKMGHGGKAYQWKPLYQLANIIAQNNFCLLVIFPAKDHRNSQFTFIGKPENIEVCVYLYEYLREQLNRLAKMHWVLTGRHEEVTNSYGEEVPAVMTQWKNAFAEGFNIEVHRRMKQVIAEVAKENQNTMALVLVTKQELEAARTNLVGEVKKSEERGRKPLKIASAFERGREEGKRVQLNKAVESTGKVGLLR